MAAPPPKRRTGARAKPAKTQPARLLFGLHAVAEAWCNPERACAHLWLTEAARDALTPALDAAAAAGLPRPEPTLLARTEIDRLVAQGAVHQGVVLDCDPLPEADISDLEIAVLGRDRAVLIALDQVTDPHNIGAILRSAAVFGASGLLLPRHGSPPVTAALAKVASGAVEHVPIAAVPNLARALAGLEQAGVACLALDERAPHPLDAVALPPRLCLVLGAEGAGLRPHIRKQCSLAACLPAAGAISSLNVSNAAAVALYAATTRAA